MIDISVFVVALIVAALCFMFIGAKLTAKCVLDKCVEVVATGDLVIHDDDSAFVGIIKKKFDDVIEFTEEYEVNE